MKAFLAAVLFFAVALAVTGFIYERVSYPASEAFSTDSARVGHEPSVDGRLGWSPDT